MSEDAQLPKDHPMRVSFGAIKATDEYASTRRWALTEAHVDGSLWAMFAAGWQTAERIAKEAKGDE